MSRTAQVTPENLRITETAHVVGEPGNAVDADGNVMVHVIRPGVGKGKGRHVYEADMLKRHADSGHFDDWHMFVDHEDPAARRRAGGLPRSVRDLGGRVMETHWDPDVPADGDHGQGAVVAKVRPVPWVRELVENDPKLAAVSINTFATGVKPTSRGGRPAYIVEGFEHDGSVDWVTRAGAGGKVVQLLEAHYGEDGELDGEELNQLLEGLDDSKLASYLRDKRPELAEALTTTPGSGTEEDEMDKDQIAEAVLETLRGDEAQSIIAEAQKAGAASAVSEALADTLPTAIGRAAEVIEAQAITGATQAVRMGRLRDKAVEVVEAAVKDGLPQRFGDDVLERIGTPALTDKVEGEGEEAKVTESAEAQFDTLLKAELDRATELVEAARPKSAKGGKAKRTAVTENGSTRRDDDEDAAAIQEDEETDTTVYRRALQESGVDFAAAYGVKKRDPEADAAAAAAAKKADTDAAAAATA